MSAALQTIDHEDRQSIALIKARSEVDAYASLIERAARDPSVDVAKLRELLTMRLEVEARAAERAFDAAMAAAQAGMRRIATDSNNPQTKSRYASYAALDRAVRPVYTDNGFSLSFNTEEGAAPDHVRVACIVAHGDGHRRKHHIDMPADGKGAKGGDVMTKTHATGSAVTYGMRYLLKMIFNLAIGEDDDDDDGNSAGSSSDKITAEQRQELQSLAEEVGADIPKYCQYMKIGSLADIPAFRFDAARAALYAKKAPRK